LFEQAEGGTLFLDEIGELELSLQAKLLRVLEEGSFRRVGGLRDLPLDVRIIAASNRDLRAESEAARFRLDLYYRLSVIQLDIPPIRERGDDVLLLAEHYIKDFGNNLKLRRNIRGISPEVKEAFLHYSWPGNVRELRNVIERALILEDNDIITLAYLPRDLTGRSVGGRPGSAFAQSGAGADEGDFTLPPEGLSLEQVEMSLVEQAMGMSNGNQTHAAELLGISRDQLRYRLKKLEQAESVNSKSAS
jgi:DNA-binding NtrC family response regulator